MWAVSAGVHDPNVGSSWLVFIFESFKFIIPVSSQVEYSVLRVQSKGLNHSKKRKALFWSKRLVVSVKGGRAITGFRHILDLKPLLFLISKLLQTSQV